MNIKDYLKYYIGQKCQYASHHEPQGELYVLTPSLLEEAIEFGDIPILRRIQSLNEHEAIELGKLLLSVNGDRCRAHKTPEGLWRIQYGNVFGEHWVIDGSIFNQFQTHYLLSLGIDLFGLIDVGLAIDAATIKTHQP